MSGNSPSNKRLRQPMDSQRKLWNERHQELRQALKIPAAHQEAIQLFWKQHAMVHFAEVSQSKIETFADVVWQGLTDNQIRTVPPKFEHSIAWNFWHMARIEDVVLSFLVANSEQVMITGNWLSKLNISRVDTGNHMDDSEMHQLSSKINVQSIAEYRTAVGLRTREVILGLTPEDLQRKVASTHIQRIWDKQALVPEAQEIADYWSKRKISGLLLMPFTRHNLLHLNESLRIRDKVTQ